MTYSRIASLSARSQRALSRLETAVRDCLASDGPAETRLAALVETTAPLLAELDRVEEELYRE